MITFKEHADVEEKYKGKFPPDLVAAAIKVAMSMAGNMTGATKKIEAMKRGLSKDKVVADTLRLVNEGREIYVMKKGKFTRTVDGKEADKMKRKGWKLIGKNESVEEARRKKPKPSARERLIKSLKKHGYDVHARAKATKAEHERLKKLYNMESVEESIELDEFTIPMSLAAKIPFLKDKVYQKAIRYYLDWRKKNPKQGSMGIAKAAKQFGVETQKLQMVLHKLIDAGKLPAHLATNPNMLGKDWNKKYDKTVGFGAR